jgi:hypothetical protein
MYLKDIVESVPETDKVACSISGSRHLHDRTVLSGRDYQVISCPRIKAAFYTPVALKLDLILDENGTMTRCLLQNEMQRQLVSTSVSNKMWK